MMRGSFSIVVVVLMLSMLAGCRGRSHDDPVPRPYGYPRVEVPDSFYRSAKTIPFIFEINNQAEVRDNEDNPQWFDVVYPKYGIEINFSFRQFKSERELEEILANRLERMSMNIGDNAGELIEIQSPHGFKTQILKCYESSLTPVQMLSVGSNIVIFATAHMIIRTPQANDSTGLAAFGREMTRPLVDVVTRDLIHSARLLRWLDEK